MNPCVICVSRANAQNLSIQFYGTNRPHNLWQAVPGDHGAHGAFDARARSWSPQLWTSEHRGWVATGLVTLAFFAVLRLLKNR